MKHTQSESISHDKIPCSVSLLTYNSAPGLGACLETLKNFAEIIVCDANSTDNTLEIARSYGAKIVKQYETDELLVPCAMDKAAVREKAMQASTLPWRFFMDSDDTLSHEVVDEIRTIVTDPHPAYWAWRMPTRIFIEDKEVKHEATYPSYQTRLVHEKVNARFEGPVHDHLVFDKKQFPLGTLKNYYNFGWPQERVDNFWKYNVVYTNREIQTTVFKSWGRVLYKGIYWRLRMILGYLLWRLPVMYIRYGFRDSMPLWIELMIVGYHVRLLFGQPLRHLTTRHWFIKLNGFLHGEKQARVQAYIAMMHDEAYGRVLDVNGGDEKRAYWKYMRTARWNRRAVASVPYESNFAFPDAHFDTVVCFDEGDACVDFSHLARESARVLRRGGTFFGITAMPENSEKGAEKAIEARLLDAGFLHVQILALGRIQSTMLYHFTSRK